MATLVEVVCPEGVGEGDMIQVEHCGQSFDVPLPAGVAAGCAFQVELPELPETLKVLRIMCMNFNQKLKLPMNLEELVILSVNFNQQLRLPERLKSLRIYSDNFKQSLEFPESLEKRQILRPFTYLW